jgi:hypothetical protein
MAPHLDPDTLAGVQFYLNNNDPRALWRLADMDTPWTGPGFDPKANTVGKAMLTDQGWFGTLSLNDPATMERFNRYVGQGK